jgi:curli biogenesis system outer membrane secretion channel CsgG
MSTTRIRFVFLLALLAAPAGLAQAQDSLAKQQQDSVKRAEKEARDSAKQVRDSAKRVAKAAEQARKDAEDAPPATVQVPPLPRAQRLPLSVLDFDYQTVIKQNNYDANTMAAIASALHGADPNSLAREDNRNIGAGLASLVKAELFKGQSFRIMERQKLGSALAEQDLAAGKRADARASQVARTQKVQAARFILTGSITKFGSDDKKIGAGGLVGGVIGAVGINKKKTIVEITAQILDASTGEVMLSLVGRGVSKKGGGLVIGGAGPGAAGIGGSANTGIKETAIGEAMQLAAMDLAAKVINTRDELIEAAAEGEPEVEESVKAEPAQEDAVSSTEARLVKLDELLQKKLITRVEYARKRTEILKAM